VQDWLAILKFIESNALAVTLAATLLTGLVKIVWELVGQALRWGRFHLNARVRVRKIDLGPFDAIPARTRLRCLIVRYGTDPYIERLASDQEKFEGRLQNREIACSTSRTNDGRMIGVVPLPVHRRLGTQFKCFFECETEDAAKALLELPWLVEPSYSKFERLPRVWFLLEGYGPVETVDGFRNNYFFAK
jgi:hypothetical protein